MTEYVEIDGKLILVQPHSFSGIIIKNTIESISKLYCRYCGVKKGQEKGPRCGE